MVDDGPVIDDGDKLRVVAARAFGVPANNGSARSMAIANANILLFILFFFLFLLLREY
jgi:hypothetical protein